MRGSSGRAQRSPSAGVSRAEKSAAGVLSAEKSRQGIHSVEKSRQGIDAQGSPGRAQMRGNSRQGVDARGSSGRACVERGSPASGVRSTEKSGGRRS